MSTSLASLSASQAWASSGAVQNAQDMQAVTRDIHGDSARNVQNALHTRQWRRGHMGRQRGERMKRAAHVLHAPVTWFASIVLWFFLLLLLDRRVVRGGGFLMRRRGGGQLLLLLVLRRWWRRGIPVRLGQLLHLHIPWPLVQQLLLVLLPLLPVQIPPGRVRWRVLRRVLRLLRPRVLRRIIRHWRQLRGHSLQHRTHIKRGEHGYPPRSQNGRQHAERPERAEETRRPPGTDKETAYITCAAQTAPRLVALPFAGADPGTKAPWHIVLSNEIKSLHPCWGTLRTC